MKKNDVRKHIKCIRLSVKEKNKILYYSQLYGFEFSDWMREAALNYNPGVKRGTNGRDKK
jgi:hypothetical protein